MKTLRAVLLLIPALASAEWRALTPLMGAPGRDVQMLDAGLVLAVGTTEARAWRVTDAGATTAVNLAGNFVGAGYYGPGCLLAFDSTRSLVGSASCPGGPVIGTGTPTRFRLLSEGPSGVAVSTNGSFDQLYSGPQPDGGWSAQGGIWSGAGDRALQATRIGGIDYVAMNANGLFARVSVDGGTPFNVTVASALRDVSPFDLQGAPALLGSTSGGQLTLVPDLRAPSTVTPSIPAGLQTRFVSIEGPVGMATTTTGVIISPIPDPARQALTWVARGPGGPALTERIDCIEEGWCAGLTTAGEVWVYENVSAPTVMVPALSVDAGLVVRVTATVSDLDGDPTFTSWSAGAGVTFMPVTGIEDGSQVELLVASGAACGLSSIDVTVRDGLTSHQRTVQVPITLIDRGVVQIAASSTAPIAGGPPISLTISVDGGCDTPTAVSWTSTDGQDGGGSQFTWAPPLTECTPGRTVTVTAITTWSSGAPPTFQTDQLLTVQPWGAPLVPSFNTPATQAAGTTALWAPTGSVHTCETATGFPGTELSWDSIDGGGAQASPVDGGLLVVAPVTCVPLQVTARARQQVVGEVFGRSSDAGTLVVDITPDTAPLGPTTQFASTFQGDAGVVFGDVTLSASCLAQRSLASEISVSSGPTLLTTQRFPAPGPWALAVPGGCAGGAFDVVAELVEDGGLTGARASGTVSFPSTPARVGMLSATRVDVVCGQGAQASLSLLPEAGSCGTSELSWVATAGPALSQTSGAGDQVPLQTAALDFSSVGQTVTLRFAADGGPGNVDVADRVVELGVLPFVELSVKAQPPLRREEEPLTLEVSVRNTTACDVDGLSLLLPVEGGRALLDSVRFDGATPAAQETPSGLRIEGLKLGGGATATFTLAVRPRLLGAPTLVPQAELAGYPVSTLATPGPGATGCGCASLADLGWWGLGLLALVRRRRRAL